MSESGQRITSAGRPDCAVRTRRIYYFSGFDPRGAAFYHRLYRDEAGKQAPHLHAPVAVGARGRSGPHVHTWQVDAAWPDGRVATEYNFCGWDDIVRGHWQANLLRLFCTSVASYAGYIASGAFGKLHRAFRGPFWSALYPFAYLALLLACALLLAGAGGYLASRAGSAAAWGAALATGGLVLWSGARLGNRLGIFWLLRTYLFVHLWGTREVAELAARIDAFAARVADAQSAAPVDEVLIVGHSVGSIVATSVAARVARTLPPGSRRNMTLVTLGQCIPLLSLLPSASGYRRDLATLGQADGMQWLDMVARADALCFSHADPLRVSEVAASAGCGPIQQVVRPFRMFDAKTYARIRRNKLRLHFQYLMAGDLANEYDYFRLTAGPVRAQPSLKK